MDVATLKALMAERGETQAEIARLLGISPDKLNKTLKGKRRLQLDEANTLDRYFGLAEPGDAKPHYLPIVGLVSAGQWREGFEVVMGYMPSPDPKLSRDSFVVIVEGDSMDLVAQPGEAIIVEPRDRDLVNGGYYIIRNGEGETTFKRYIENPARLEPCSSNPEHEAIYPGQSPFEVIGRVRKKVTDL
jgi:repressor LexA